jgi:hypothetical protein
MEKCTVMVLWGGSRCGDLHGNKRRKERTKKINGPCEDSFAIVER